RGDGEATLADGVVVAPHEEVDLVSALREARAVVAADRSSADHCDAAHLAPRSIGVTARGSRPCPWNGGRGAGAWRLRSLRRGGCWRRAGGGGPRRPMR